MHMAYTTNPHLPRLRMKTANLVLRSRWSVRKAARYTGVHPGTVTKWVKKARILRGNTIPTCSSRPHSHPNSLDSRVVERIVAIRRKRGRCAEVVHQHMINEGYTVSVSSVKRTLERHLLIKKRSPWKRYHAPMERPYVVQPGDLVEIDTIHIGPHRPGRLYVYTLLDVFSRWAWAEVGFRINTHRSIVFVAGAHENAPFRFRTLQSDHGSEFSTYFTEHMNIRGWTHRHTRVRKPNDNAHIERFNRTIQEECLTKIPQTLKSYQKEISEYLHYYNYERLHLGLRLKTPMKCFQGID